jgi:hypothetical protein
MVLHFRLKMQPNNKSPAPTAGSSCRSASAEVDGAVRSAIAVQVASRWQLKFLRRPFYTL